MKEGMARSSERKTGAINRFMIGVVFSNAHYKILHPTKPDLLHEMSFVSSLEFVSPLPLRSFPSPKYVSDHVAIFEFLMRRPPATCVERIPVMPCGS